MSTIHEAVSIGGSSTPVIALYGPTASGKTALAIELARALGGNVVSADSRLVFRGLDIGTAKPTADERSRVRHYGIDICEPGESFSTGAYRRYADGILSSLNATQTPAVIAGGTGLYIKSLVQNFLSEDDVVDSAGAEDIRHEIHVQRESGHADVLYEELERVDPVSAARYSDRNPRRVDRALMYYRLHGVPLSDAQSMKVFPAHSNIQLFVLQVDTQELNARIEQRVVHMWECGFEVEVRNLLHSGLSPSTQSLATVGYREMIAYINGDLTKAQAQQAMVISTRQYAKRQRTWARHQFPDAITVQGTTHTMVEHILSNIQQLQSTRTP